MIEDKIDSLVEIRNKNGSRGYAEGILVFDCPFCGDKKARGWVNTTRLTAGCFNAGCLVYGGISLKRWMSDIGSGISFYRPPLYLDTEENVDLGCASTALPEPYVYLSEKPFPDVLVWCMNKWHVTAEHILRFSPFISEHEAWKNRIIFPITMHNETVGFSGRSLFADEIRVKYSIPKWKHSKNKVECSLPSSYWIYNIDSVSHSDPVILLEGIGDVIGFSFLKNVFAVPIAIFGSFLQKKKLHLILDKSPSEIYVGLDNDAVDLSRKIITSFTSLGYKTYLVRWKNGKDAGEGLPVIESVQKC